MRKYIRCLFVAGGFAGMVTIAGNAETPRPEAGDEETAGFETGDEEIAGFETEYSEPVIKYGEIVQAEETYFIMNCDEEYYEGDSLYIVDIPETETQKKFEVGDLVKVSYSGMQCDSEPAILVDVTSIETE